MAASRLRAALWSRSWVTPHWHAHALTARVSPALIAPQSPPLLLDGYHLSAAHPFAPSQPVLYSNCRTNSPNPASETARASRRFRTIPATLRLSTATARLVLASLVVSWCRKSARRWATFKWIVATRSRALARLFESFRERCSALFARRSLRCAALSARGAWTSSTSPVSSAITANVLRPRSIPHVGASCGAWRAV